MENKIQYLEEALAHQQLSIDEMGQEIFVQQKEIQRLTKVISYLKDRIDGIDDALYDMPSADQKPPHY